jgi:DNA recombination protein RmuC
MDGLWIVLSGVVGLIAGAAIVAWANRAQLVGLSKSASDASAELVKAREERAVAETKAGRIEELVAEITARDRLADALREENASHRENLKEVQARLDAERSAIQEQRELLEKKVAETFTALSSDALRKNNTQFLDLAKEALSNFNEQAKGDLEKRQQAIGELVKPIEEKLKHFDESIKGMEKERVGAYEQLREQVKTLAETHTKLQSETQNLVRALRNPGQRGQWGEMQLERILEFAGLREKVHFEKQVSVTSEEGGGRPDYVVRFATGQRIVIDSKVPLEAYLDAQDLADDELRAAKLRDHARHVRGHVQSLMRRSYQDRFESLDFVVMFLPAESLFSAALQYDPALIEFGVENRVFIASPITLIGMLRSVAMGWRQEQLAENAKVISDEAKELYARFSVVGKHFKRLGDRLDDVVSAYNDTVGSMDTRLLPQARRLKELQVTTADDIPTASAIDRTLPTEAVVPSSSEDSAIDGLFEPPGETSGSPALREP